MSGGIDGVVPALHAWQREPAALLQRETWSCERVRGVHFVLLLLLLLHLYK